MTPTTLEIPVLEIRMLRTNKGGTILSSNNLINDYPYFTTYLFVLNRNYRISLDVAVQISASDSVLLVHTTVFTTSENPPSNWEFPIPNCKFPTI